nr:STAS domain-containing protein [Bowmanella dokdonensis]
MTIYDVAGLEKEIFPQGPSVGNWKLDLSAVAEIDGAGIQWLMTFMRRIRQAGGSVTLTHLSDAVLQASELLGLNWHKEQGA